MRPASFASLLALVLPLSACEGCTSPGGDGGVPGDGGPSGLVVINELMAANRGSVTDDFDEPDDWIELYNPGAVPVDLEGFQLSDDPLVPARHVFAAGVEIPAGGFLVVWADRQPFQGALHVDFRLAREGEELRLTAPSGEVVDELSYPVLDDDQSFGRYPDGEGEPLSLSAATPGAANAAPTGDAGPEDGGADAGPVDGGEDAGPEDGGFAARDVVLNELLVLPTSPLADAEGDLVTLPWVELKNTGAVPVDLSDHYLSDDPADPTQSPLGGLAVLQPGDHFVVFGNSEPVNGLYHGTFRLEAGGGTLLFASPAGEILQRYDYGAQAPGVSEGRSPDGDGPFVPQGAATPRAANLGPPDAGSSDDGGAMDAGVVDDAGGEAGLADAGLADGGVTGSG